jgi:Rad3-related DNA helicase
MLPDPVDLGLPPQFSAWRAGQVEAILTAIDRPERFKGLVLPTGFGKSLVYMATAALTGRRTVILTATKALQKQLMRDFRALAGTALVQGQRAYVCKALDPGGELFGLFGTESTERRITMVDHGPCHLGVDCSLKNHGCTYFDALREAMRAQIVITNYAWWFTLYKKAIIPLRPELLVLDEAHDAPDALSEALGATVSPELVGKVLNEKLPVADKLTKEDWIKWAEHRALHLKPLLEGTKPRSREAVAQVRKAQTLLYALEQISTMDPRLLLVSDKPDGVRFDVVWAAEYAERWLFRSVPSVVLTSATMTRHTADLLGIMEKDLHLHEAGEGFDAKRRPVYIAPAKLPPFGQPVRVDHRMTQDAELALLAHIDQIIAARPGRSAIIHTISYKRRDLVIAKSQHRERMMTHGRHDTAAQILKFKSAQRGTVLVSPAVTTGYDFPYDQCEYQIIVKIPFPDGRDPVTAARSLVDKRYPSHLAMQTLVQSVGRGMRAADDRCETFIVDAHAVWFLSKHADLAPKWFRRAVKKLDPGVVPQMPPPVDAHLVESAEGVGDTV